MADSLNPLDVKALEQSVNDSATRVSTIWISFLLFGLYLVVAAGAVTHRQLMLEDPVKLPALNIDLPLVGFFFLAPLLFVILHAYVLVQVLLLAHTAAAYNEALECSFVDASDRARVRQRLANTLFAQMFAGSPREREGLLGAFLRLMAWVTLAIAPVLVLLTFEVRFLPYHSSLVTWNLRILIALDLAGVLLLWGHGVLDAQRDITWRGVVEQHAGLLTAVLLVLFSFVAVSFPGEWHTNWMRPDSCSSFISRIIPDNLSLQWEVLIDTKRLTEIETAAKATEQMANQVERTRRFQGRDLSCGQFIGADLRRADFTSTNLQGANLLQAQLQDADLTRTQLQRAVLTGAQLQSVKLNFAQLRRANLRGAQLRGAYLSEAQLEGADLGNAQLQGANLTRAQLRCAPLTGAQRQCADLTGAQLVGANFRTAALQGAWIQGADLRDLSFQGADLSGAQLQGANLTRAQLQGADLIGAQLQGANLTEAQLQGADLSEAQLQGANLTRAQLQGARLDASVLTYADLSGAYLWRARGMKCHEAQVTAPEFRKIVQIKFISEGGAQTESTLDGIEEFIEETMRDVPESERQKLQAKLRTRLISDAHDDAAGEHVWHTCVAKALPENEYAKKHVDYLINLICHAEPDQKKQKHVAEGIYRNWTSDSFRTVILARGLLGLGGKPCPGAKEVSQETKATLRNLTAANPTK